MEALPQPVSRRRTREEVQADVRDALVGLLAERPFKDITIDELARRAGLSRTAFYFYYPDKNEVLKEAAETVAAEVYAAADRLWHGSGPPEQLVREAIEGIAAVYSKHGDMFRAGLEVTTYDEEFRKFYWALIGRFVDATAEHLRRELATGRARPLDVDVVAESLVWMAERCAYAFFLIEGRPESEVIEPLVSIWVHAVYPDAQLPGRP
jgi:TetR/AcrR family transcriptional regulator, ethionamide resistance regulator